MAEKMFDTAQVQEKVILAGVSTGDVRAVEDSLDELEQLAKTAGAQVVGRLIQSREAMHPGLYFGKGKVDELAELIAETGADGVICDDELSPAQMANLTEALDTKVMDRTLLILDIFAGRATTSEGKIQVELAQLRYRATRLTGFGKSMSRLGGGIGTRGPGETRLEVDRRRIRERISQLRQDLAQVVSHREVSRRQRSKSPIPVFAIVGYTNAGKSTMLNTLTRAGVLEEDQLFATLDPTTRNYTLPGGQDVLLTDTVGFIHKLPHHLVDAFRSTLEEARYADYIIHMVDASNPQMPLQMQVVYDTLQKLEITGKTVITAFNKIDLVSAQAAQDSIYKDFSADYSVRISAKSEEGMAPLLSAMEQVLREGRALLEIVLPYKDGATLSAIHKYGEMLSEDYREDGVAIRAYVPRQLFEQIKNA